MNRPAAAAAAAAAAWRQGKTPQMPSWGGALHQLRRRVHDAADTLALGEYCRHPPSSRRTVAPRLLLFPAPTSPRPRPNNNAEYQLGRPPAVVPFEISAQQARDRFLAWQRASTARLAPAGLLPEAAAAGGEAWRLRPAYLPFWLFDVTARVQYAGSVGIKDK